MGLGLIALAVCKKASVAMNDEEGNHRTPDPEDATRQATAAVAPYIVTIVRRLGGSM